MQKSTPARQLATWHLFVMVTATRAVRDHVVAATTGLSSAPSKRELDRRDRGGTSARSRQVMGGTIVFVEGHGVTTPTTAHKRQGRAHTHAHNRETGPLVRSRPASHERHPMSEISAAAVVGPAPSSRAEQRDPQRPLKPRTRSRGASPPADPATNPALVYLMWRLT